MKVSPLTSIALCTYNGERFLRQQIDSLLSQDYPNFEIVAVDDASTDATPAILQSYAKRDDRVRIHLNSTNLGFRKNFERAISLCSGDFIAPCDQDDVWMPHKISTLLNTIGRALLVYSDSEMIDATGKPLGRRISDIIAIGEFDDPMALVFSNCGPGHTMLFRRELLATAFPFPQPMFHDWWLAFLAASSSRVACAQECLVHYRQHEGQVTDFAGLKSNLNGRQQRGHKLAHIREIEQRLQVFSTREDSPAAPLLRQMYSLWRQREHQLVCIRLSLFMLRYRFRLFALIRDERLKSRRMFLRYLWGVPVKRVFQRHQYSLT